MKTEKWYDSLKVGQKKDDILNSIPSFIPDSTIYTTEIGGFNDCVAFYGPEPNSFGLVRYYHLCFKQDTLVDKGFSN